MAEPEAKRLKDGSVKLCWTDVDSYTDPHTLTPVVRFFGRQEDGESAMVNVRSFIPYIYCDIPPSKYVDIDMFQCTLENALRNGRPPYECKHMDRFVLSVEEVDRESVYGYSPMAMKKYWKIRLAVPSLVSSARYTLQRGDFSFGNVPPRVYNTFESNLPFVIQVMIDMNIVGCNWIELPVDAYEKSKREQMTCTCDNEYTISYKDVVSHTTEKISKIAKQKILSFDIECIGRPGVFVNANIDPIIQIGCVEYLYGDPKHLWKKTVFVLGGCLDISNVTVKTYKREVDLLCAFRDFVVKSDPDILTGYNIQDFDMPYLLNRAEHIGIGRYFSELGRVKGSRSVMKSHTFSSAAFGTRTSIDTTIPGRVMMDMIVYMRRNHKLSSYSLNGVCAEFLGDQKEDVPISAIAGLHRGSDADRQRIATYCVKDALLPVELMTKLCVFVNYVEMARVTGVPLLYLFTRGQQIKVLTMIYRKARKYNMIVPVFVRDAEDHSAMVECMEAVPPDEGGKTKDVGYEGATVLDPKRGFHNTPVATLDFASLYPSIMRAHNLCYSTLLTPAQALAMKEDERSQSPCGHWFLTTKVRPGLLPIILGELLDARSKAKKDMKNAKDEFERDVMNGRQLALKISANSVYGFTGATIGSLPCLAISASVTAYGREGIERTKDFVEKNYTIANGYPADADVIYGDTDSVMVVFGVKTVAEAMKLGKEAAKRVTGIFPELMSLEFEKVYYPYLLMGKKRYAGMYYSSSPDKADKMEAKGLEIMRRDCCELTRQVMKVCLKKIMEGDVKAAVRYAKQAIAALLQGKIDLSMLIVTKELKDTYKTPQPHKTLADKMRKRDAGSAPQSGDRVAYVIVKGPKKACVHEKSEHPMWVLDKSIPVDFTYYLENQLTKPLTRLFEFIIPDTNDLFHGDHTRSVFRATPAMDIGIMRFTQSRNTCLGCRAVLDPNREDQALCDGCQNKRQHVYLNKQSEMAECEKAFAKQWTECQRCQGSFYREVMCESSECPIFFRRKKVQKDMTDLNSVLKRLKMGDELELF